jgi:hypothetical protein
VDLEKWSVAFEDKSVAVLENKNFTPPYTFIAQGQGFENHNFSRIELIEKKDDLWVFKIKTDVAGIFVLRENFFPGWRVEVDGKEEDIIVWEGTFKGVWLKPGQHRVVFYFKQFLF